MNASARQHSYCLHCAHPAPVVAQSLDSLHPMVRCQRSNGKGETTGCGITVGTYDQRESEGAVRWHKVQHATARHIVHVARGEPNKLCETCAIHPPTRNNPQVTA